MFSVKLREKPSLHNCLIRLNIHRTCNQGTNRFRASPQNVTEIRPPVYLYLGYEQLHNTDFFSSGSLTIQTFSDYL